MNKKLLALVVLSALGTWGGANATEDLTFSEGVAVRTDSLNHQKLGDENTPSISVILTNNSKTDYGYLLVNKDTAGNVPVPFTPLNGSITAHSINIDTTASDSTEDAGIWAQGQIDLSSDLSNTKDRSVLTIKANKLDIKANYAALVAYSGSAIDINADTVKLTGENIISARGGSRIKIDATTTQLEGNIEFSFANNSGTSVNADIDLTLNGNDSFWVGNSYVSWEQNSARPADNLLTVSSAPKLTLKDGASWTPTQITDGRNQKSHQLKSLTLDNGVVNLNSDVKTGVKNLSGSGTFNVAVKDGNTGTFSVVDADDSVQLQVNLTGVDSDTVDSNEAQNLVNQAFTSSITNDKITTHVNEGFYNGAYSVGPDGNVKTSDNSIMRDTLDIASGSTVMLNRILMNDVHKRLGDLRNSAGMNGAWVRYDGGRLSGGHVANKFNTIQIGADMPFAENFHAGVAASYTRGDVDFTRGGAGMDAYSFAAYGTWFAPNGMYADVVARYGYVKNELTVDHNLKGDLDNNAVALSGEFGWKFDVAKDFFVTPQVEASYMHIDSDNVKLGNKASYKFDSVDSFIGRAGLAAGYTFPNQKGNVFVKASAVHEFAGDSKVTGANGTSLKKDGKDTWAEFGIGAQYNFNKNVQAWANLERTAGADIEEDYRATVGVRINF